MYKMIHESSLAAIMSVKALTHAFVCNFLESVKLKTHWFC